MCRPERWIDIRGRPPLRALSELRTRRRRRSKSERCLAILLLLAFLAENILAAIFDTLALVRLGLAPAANLGGDLADLLLVVTADLDRGLIRRLDRDPLGHLEIDV